MTKAVVLRIDSDDETTATAIARLVGACLTLNGYDAGTPEVIDWPPPTDVARRRRNTRGLPA